jgi:hypothetical protein
MALWHSVRLEFHAQIATFLWARSQKAKIFCERRLFSGLPLHHIAYGTDDNECVILEMTLKDVAFCSQP